VDNKRNGIARIVFGGSINWKDLHYSILDTGFANIVILATRSQISDNIFYLFKLILITYSFNIVNIFHYLVGRHVILYPFVQLRGLQRVGGFGGRDFFLKNSRIIVFSLFIFVYPFLCPIFIIFDQISLIFIYFHFINVFLFQRILSSINKACLFYFV